MSDRIVDVDRFMGLPYGPDVGAEMTARALRLMDQAREEERERILGSDQDARVRAAAPELADALESLVRWLTAWERNEATTSEQAVEAVDAARAALAKAGRLP